MAEKTVQSLPFKRSMASLSKVAGRVANREYSRAMGFRADPKTKTLAKFNKPCKEVAICFTSTVDSVNRFASALIRSTLPSLFVTTRVDLEGRVVVHVHRSDQSQLHDSNLPKGSRNLI